MPTRKKSEFKLLTPADARELLKMNTHNRRLNEKNVLMWAQEMEEGRWASNGEAIKISETGVLLDGQNRLTALTLQQESVAIEFLVVTGLPDNVQNTMDQGEFRSLAQQLCLSDIEADKILAAALRLHCLWSTGKLFLDGPSARRYTTAPAMVDYAKNNPAALQMLRTGRRYRRAPLKESLTLVSFAMICQHHSEQAASEFFQSLSDGAGLAAGSPILALRNRLINVQTERVRLTNQTLLGYVVTAFNAWVAGRPMSKIVRPRDGMWTKDSFPPISAPRPGDVIW